MDTRIRQLNLSYICGTTFAEFAPSTALPAYETLFAAAKSAPATDPPGGPLYWRLPWPPNLKGRQKFWERFIDIRLEDLNSTRALKFLVPFRIRLARISADWLKPGSAYIQGYRYPHRLAVVVCVNAIDADGYDLQALMDQARNIRKDGLYSVTWLDDDTQAELTLDNLARAALNHLLDVSGLDKTPRLDDIDPFTIATVVKGEFDPGQLSRGVAENGPIHRALFALCTGQKPLELAADDCERRRLKKLGSDALASDILYARYRSRACWFPQSFSRTDPRKPLGCYHNNLTFASLQTDSLLAAVRLADEKIRKGQPTTGIAVIAKPAAGLIGALYGPNPKKIYQSWSVREQIRQEREAVNNVRKVLLPGGKLLPPDD